MIILRCFSGFVPIAYLFFFRLIALLPTSIPSGRLLIKYRSSMASSPSSPFTVFRVRMMLLSPFHSFFWLSHDMSSVCQYSRFSILPLAAV